MPICMRGIVSRVGAGSGTERDVDRAAVSSLGVWAGTADLRCRAAKNPPSHSAPLGNVPERTPDMLFIILIVLLILALGGYIGRNRYSRR